MIQESTILGIQFGIFSPDEIRKSSVAEIVSRDTYVNNKAVVGGMFDTRMGTLEPGLICPTDGLDYIQCPGYFGHIELARPVFYIQYLDTVINIIKCICIKCSKVLIDKRKYRHLLTLSSERRWKRVHTLCHNIKRCGEFSETGCGCQQPSKYKQEGFATVIAEWKFDEKPVSLKITPEMFIKIFRRISDEDIAFLGFSPIWSRPEWMICQVLAVPPPSVRPSVKYDSSQRSEDDLTYILVQIIKANSTLKKKLADGANTNTIDDYHSVLQFFIATLIDNKIPNAKPAAQRSGRAFKSIKDRLNGKTGRVRGNLMGKRVDFSARSVITPDPNLSIRELGVPLKIAQNITKPVTVNSRNIHSLAKLVLNGPEYPGAKLLERTINGHTVHISLKYADRESIQLQEGDIVHRHMLDGDAILFNRQPTLHRMSMMGHIVRVMYKGNTFRMNVGDTKPYNADFDGDEMNLHMPQTIEAETELRHLAAVPYQIISPASNQSIIGIFQDSLLGSFQFTRPNISFDPLTAMNLVVNLINVDEKIFSSRNVSNFKILSLILPPMTCKQTNKLFKEDENATTSNNIIEIINGEYKRGQLDKGALSATSKGLIHRLFNDFGNFASADFIDNIQYIVNEYMKSSSFSVGISDLLTSTDTQTEIKECIRRRQDDVDALIVKTHMNTFENETGKTNMEELEMQIGDLLGKANDEAGKIGKASLQPDNRFVGMVQAGSKGSDINISQMVSCLGQQQVEGKRIPYGYDHRSLPHFTKYDDTPSARGFVGSSFISGLNPFELFFHAQGGRIGLIDTAVKTSTTGYIQRRLIKAMEDCISLYDGTVRNNKNKIIQFTYGEDNIDAGKVEAFHMPLCELKIENIIAHYTIDATAMTEDVIMRHNTQDYQSHCTKWIDFMIHARDDLIRHVFNYKNDYKVHVPVGITFLISNIGKQFMLCNQTMIDITPFEMFVLLDKYYAKLEGLGSYKPSMLFKIMYYYCLTPVRLLKEHYTRDALIMLLEQIVMQYKKSIIQPGEMVGIIAAQSIGEPTTQMTLNTFHFAGVASKSNVTRGVPRIEEILSLSANLKNPSITVYLKEVDETNKERAQHFMYELEHTKLLDITKKVEIIFDPDGTAQMSDSAFIRDAKEFKDLLQDCAEPQVAKENPWVIRIVLKAEEMLNKKITMDDVNFSLRKSEFNAVDCVYSDYNADELVFRIRPFNPSKKENKNKNKSVFYNMDHIYYLKEVQTKLMNIVLRGVKHIKKVNIRVIKNNVKWVDGEYENCEIWVLDTVGTNFMSVLGLDYIDATRTISNDIKETCDVLGIEAARECIYSELTEVIEFESYINDHHKSLLCDRMACTYPMTSIFRHGVNKDDIGPIAKASFEETPEMFFQAARHAELDNMRGISANVMCGQEGHYGTTSFGLLLDMGAIKHLEIKKPIEINIDQGFSSSVCDTIKIHNNLSSIAETLEDLTEGEFIQL